MEARNARRASGGAEATRGVAGLGGLGAGVPATRGNDGGVPHWVAVPGQRRGVRGQRADGP